MPQGYPPHNFATAKLTTTIVPAGEAMWRVYGAAYRNRLGAGFGHTRWSAPWRLRARRYRLIYGARRLTDAFAETVLRDRSDGIVGPLELTSSELTDWQTAQIRLREPLTIVDLYDVNVKRIGMPTDALRGTDQALGREWGWALHEHPRRIDGIRYPSRHTSGLCLCVFERAHGKLGKRARSCAAAARHGHRPARHFAGFRHPAGAVRICTGIASTSQPCGTRTRRRARTHVAITPSHTGRRPAGQPRTFIRPRWSLGSILVAISTVTPTLFRNVVSRSSE